MMEKTILKKTVPKGTQNISLAVDAPGSALTKR